MTLKMTDAQLQRFMQSVQEAGACWIWTGLKFKTGYAQFKLNKKTRRAHRVAYEHFVGEIPSGLLVRHECDNPLCVNPEHLIVGTQLDNMKDKLERGRQARGEKHYLAKLTAEQVFQIRSLYVPRSREFSQMALARKYGVDQTTIGDIVRGQKYKHPAG